MYEIKNGILYADGVPKFALGASYYPSFLPSKYPVPADGDRIGEMKKDFKLMRDIGMHFVRCAALAELSLDGDEVKVDSPFIDEMAREAERADIGLSIRLNGYFVNLRGNENYEFINNRGEEINKRWNNFMYSSFYHEGSCRDNRDATKALSAHYSVFPSVISWQIYNEPHYPNNGVFDYNPLTIEAYRRWLADNGYMSAEDAAKYDPPRERPREKSQLREWVLWRTFSCRSMSQYLDDTAKAALEASGDRYDAYTCYTNSHVTNNNANNGVTFFDDTKYLTTLGFTHYINFDGADYFPAAYILHLAESAAALLGKHAWSAELDSRTKMPSRKLRQSTIEMIGSGCKGICYYAWRGDYPDPDTPLPDNCGFLHYDGTKSGHFDRSAALLRWLDSYSTRIALAEKKRSGVAILHSDSSYYYFDGFADPLLGAVNLWCYATVAAYRELRECGFAVDFIRAEDLAANRLGVELLFVPSRKGLSDVEKQQIEAFIKAGGKVYFCDQGATFESVAVGSWWDWQDAPKNRTTDEFRGGAYISDILERIGRRPFIETNSRHLFASVIEGDGYYIASLVNNDPYERPVSPRIKLNLPVRAVKYATPELETELAIDNGCVQLPEVIDGALLVMEKA